MTKDDLHPLNLATLENRLRELGLKNWWVAEQIGVDRKTVSRWLSGKVRTIRDDNLHALAQILKTRSEALVLTDETQHTASTEEQSEAARLIVEENLVSTLGPTGQWPLLESLVKATMQPRLPLPLMGKLYNLLSICSWRQDQMEKAWKYAEHAREIGERCGSRAVIAGAKQNMAILSSFRGELTRSIALHEECIAESRFLEDERAVAAALSNLAQDLHIYGDFERSRELQLQAIEAYEKLKLPMNISIAYCALGLLETELRRLEAAEAAIRKSQEHALTANYVRGAHVNCVYLADILARAGKLEDAFKLLEEGLAGLKSIGLDETLVREIAGRVHRLAGRPDRAAGHYEQGLELAARFPLERASLLVEMGRQAEALEIYRQAGARKRMELMK